MINKSLLLAGLLWLSPCVWGTKGRVNTLWCGYTPEWNTSYSTITYQSQNYYESNDIEEPLNLMTGVFQAKHTGYHTVTLTAVVGGMLPSKPGDILMEISPVYAQLYVKINGRLIMNTEAGHQSYVIVTPREVAQLEMTEFLTAGDTVEVYTGHVTSYKLSREAYNHRITSIPGGYLEDVTFCVVHH